MVYGVTPQGFVVKPQSQIISELNAAFRNAFGADLDVSPDTPNGQLIGLYAQPLTDLWEQAQAIYDAFNPNAATGISLSNLVQLNYLERLDDSSSTVNVVFTGTPNTFISANGFIATTVNTGFNFTLIDDVVIPVGGAITVQMVSISKGAVPAPAGTLTVITTPITGLTSITNPADAILGRAIETDPQLRVRRDRSTEINAQNIDDSLFAAVLSLEGVIDAQVRSNGTDTVDGNGLLPHSIAVSVQGGVDDDIRQAIFNNKPSSIQTNGNITGFVLNSQGFEIPINFYRPTLLNIHIEVDVVMLPGFPSDGLNQIKQAIFNYVTGVTTGVPPFGIAKNVIASQLYIPINSVPYVSVNALKLGVNSASGITDINVGFNQLSAWNINNIVVNAI